MNNRRIVLLVILIASACLPGHATAMVFKPEKGAIWDPSVLWHDGKFYAFMMYNKDGNDGLCLLATSPDGVHWEDQGPVIDDRARPDGATFFKCFVGRCGDKFIMDHGVFKGGTQDTMRFYQSNDLRHWQYLATTHPDERWYSRERWDHMYILPKEEGKPEAGYWGYIVAVSKAPNQLPAMMESRNGTRWEALPPAKTEWGTTTPINYLEYGGCERIGGKYYLIGGDYRGYMGNKGYAVWTLVSDSPRGPFRPDTEAFRLCGNSQENLTWLPAWVRGKDELLISNYSSARPGDRAPWLLPLRKPIVDKDGHLRLGWWKGNEAIKGEPLAIKARSLSLRGEGKPGGYDVAYLDGRFDFDQGVVLEGKIRARATASAAQGAARPTAGLVIETTPGQAAAVEMGIGRPEGRQTHIGRLTTGANKEPRFASEDVTGKGCATVTGLDDDKEHTFRLLCRRELFELYVDELLVQTYVCGPGAGRVGFLACNAAAEVTDLRAWTMSFSAPKDR